MCIYYFIVNNEVPPEVGIIHTAGMMIFELIGLN